MLAPTSTRNGACCTARGDISTRARSACSTIVGERRRLLEIARLRRFPEDQIDRPRAAAERRQLRIGRLGQAARLRVGAIDAQVVDLGALHRGPDGGVGVNADEDIGLLAVGVRRSLVERHRPIVVARENDAQPETALDQRAQAPRHRERDVLLEGAAAALRAQLVAAVARIDHDGAHAGRGHRDRDGGISAAGGAAGGVVVVAGASVPGGSRSMTTRELLASGCEVVTRCMPNFGPVHEAHGVGRLAGLQRLQELLLRKRGQGQVERVGFEGHREAAGSAVTRAERDRRDVEGHRCVRRSRLDRATTRGTRRSPTMSSRAGRRRSRRVSSASAERARQKVERHQPAVALADRRGRQRHQPPGHGDDRSDPA